MKKLICEFFNVCFPINIFKFRSKNTDLCSTLKDKKNV